MMTTMVSLFKFVLIVLVMVMLMITVMSVMDGDFVMTMG